MFEFVFDKFFPVTQDTKYVGEGSIFFAFEGRTYSGVSFIPLAVQKGAKEIVVSYDYFIADDIIALLKNNNVALTYSHDMSYDLMVACQRAYKNCQKEIFLVGITGTKGKTSTSILTAKFFELQNFSVGLLSSKYNQIKQNKYDATLTTPKLDYIYAFLYECFLHNVTHVVIEVAAQAMTMHRILGLEFDALVFTNFGNEHGEFYATQEEYFNAKKQLFMQLKKNGIVYLNNDDVKLISFIEELRNQGVCVCTFGKNLHSNMFFSSVCVSFLYTSFSLFFDQYFYDMRTILHGEYMIYNIAAALSVVRNNIFINMDVFFKAVNIYLNNNDILNNEFYGVGTRYIINEDLCVYIDKAHTAESFESVLKHIKNNKNDFLTVIFGCGGERDKKKRALMAHVCELVADEIIVTEDNPRHESLVDIMGDILKGFTYLSKVYMIPAREEAIAFALRNKKKGHIVALLGKGGDHFQIRKNEKIYFNEVECIKKYSVNNK